jgi:uncharacterized membrane protein
VTNVVFQGAAAADMSRLEFLSSNLRSSFWFVPSLIFVASIAAAVGLVELDSGQARPWIEQWPRVFGSGAPGARGMLSTIAASMMTVVGVTFSMTLVTLALASSQYTSRILRNFMSDRITQVALGVFGGIYIYCLIVLRTIRGGEETFIPSLAVFFGVVLAMGGIVVLIVFIHHIAASIQASSIIESVTAETLASIDRLTSKHEDDARGRDPPVAGPAPEDGEAGRPVVSRRIGYIQSTDVSALLRLAHVHDLVIRVERGVGEFVVKGAMLATVAAREGLPGELADDIEAAFNIFRFRTIEQDPGFGIRQIVDIALRALSPSVNDTTTGVMCVDYLSAILAHLVNREFPACARCCENTLRVVSREPTFEGLLTDAFDQIRGSAHGNVSVLVRMLEALRAVAAVTHRPRLRKALAGYLPRVQEMRASLASEHERARFEEALAGARSALHA